MISRLPNRLAARTFLLAGIASCAAAFSVDTALAVFPGENGLIAFSNYDPGNLTGQVSIVTAEEEGTLETLTSTGLLNDVPSWSADGGRLAFYSTRDGNREIYVMNPDGSGQTRLTDDPAFDYLATWLTDGQSLFFASDRDGDFEVYRISATGGVPRKLTDNTALDMLAQSSPACDKIVFISDRDGDNEIFVMDLDGTNQTQLTFNAAMDIYPDWSPDGTRIVFASERPGSNGRDIWIMDADGSNQEILITGPNSDSEAAFSPDGSMIVWSSDRAGGLPSLYIAPVDDVAEAVQVAVPVLKDHRGPDWQPLEPEGGFAEVECPLLVICGDANADFDITASDALQVLRTAVGQPVTCGFPRCDTDDAGSVLASDAQRVLRFAVGQNVILDCPLP